MVTKSFAPARLTAVCHKWILFGLLLGLSIQVKPQQYSIREFTDGLAQPYVYSIIQDNKGYLWIGTGNGLSRYDGFNFKNFTTNDSLADNFITCSLKNEGDIWFGHMNGKITLYNGKIFKPAISLQQNSSITDMEKSPEGTLWASTSSNGLVKLDKKNHTQKTTENDQISILTFQFLNENEILTGSVEGLDYCKLNASGKVELIRHINEIPDSKIQDIVKMKNGSGFFVATESEGIYQLEPEGKQFKISKIEAGPGNTITGVQSLFEAGDSGLWVCTFGNGLIHMVPSLKGKYIVANRFNTTTGFAANDVKTIYQDREGCIWSGNYGTGLTQLTEMSFSMYTFDKSKYGNEIYSICIRNNYRWLGTEKGLLKLSQSTGDILKFYSIEQGLPNDKITALYSDQDNVLWIGTEKNGVYRMAADKGKILPVMIGRGVLENSITAITGSKKEIWIGTKKGVCNINHNTAAIRWYTMDNGELPHNYVKHLFIGPSGKLWISTLSNVLVFIKDGKTGKEAVSSERGVSSLGPITVENDSTLWVGSNGNGVFRLKSGIVTNFTSREDLFSDYCYSLVLDDSRNLWVGHRGGLSKIRTTDLFVKPIQRSAGISSTCEFNPNAAFKDDKNKIWFGTSEGLLVYDPASESREILPPVLNIISCQVNDDEVDFHDKLTLSPGNYKIKIDFLCISLKEPSLINYVYQLEGYDHSPVNTKVSNVVFPHLTEGSYTFRLWAINGQGVISETPLTIQITINKPLWKRAWFVVSILLVLFFVLLVYIKKRDQKHLAEKKMLETKVQERTLEITKKNSLLEEKQDKIITQNTELEKYRNYLEDIVDERTRELLIAKNNAEESDRLKSSFLNNISHEIRTPLNIISGFTTLLGDNDLIEDEKLTYIKTINTNADSLCLILDEILDVSKMEAGQFVFSNTQFNVDDVFNDIESKFRLNNTKNLEFEFTNKSPDNGLELYYDKARFRQIFVNLLSNAFKFTESGSIKFGFELQNGSVRFFVSDTGLGIARAEIDKIFNPFYKIEDSRDILYGGAGIGLTTAKRLTELMGGTITVESVVGEGSVFYITLPVNAEHRVLEEKSEKKFCKKGFLKNNTLIIATAEQDIFEFITKTLNGTGAKILQAVKPYELLDFIDNNPLNTGTIILLDIKQPYTESYKIFRQINALNSDIPVIALTSFTQSADKQKIADEDFDGYLAKPIKADTLLRLLFQLSEIKGSV